MALMRQFDSGATRNLDESKYDHEGFLSPLVLERYAAYMHRHRVQADGTLRDSDNWQKGIPLVAYIKSAWRHFFDLWCWHRGIPRPESIEEACCALMFNIMGYLHEYLKAKAQAQPAPSIVEQIAANGIDDDDVGLRAGEAIAPTVHC